MKDFSEFLSSLKDKRICVIGIGVSNTPLIYMLLRAGARVFACDKKRREELGRLAAELEEKGVKLNLGEDYLKNIDADMIFKTPGLRFDIPELLAAKEGGCVITSEMEVFLEYCPAEIIAVTGSDGKTTTTTLIYELLKEAGFNCHLGGNIGKPLLPEIESIKETDRVVLELSSFQLQTMKKSAKTAVLTNITPNHLDMHKSMDEYIEAKKNIYKFQNEKDLLVLNRDNELSFACREDAAGRVRLFSRSVRVEEGMFISDGMIFSAIKGKAEEIMPVSEIKIPGMHNAENFMAAYLAVSDEVSVEAFKKVARNFSGVAHRIEFVGEVEGVSYYNDSIASSPTRTIAGLHAFSKPLIVILGGYDKKIAFDELGVELCNHAKIAILNGATAKNIEAAIRNAPNFNPEKTKIIMCETLKDAIFAAKKNACEGDIVTLSPACAAFDQFENFMKRGEFFKQLIIDN